MWDVLWRGNSALLNPTRTVAFSWNSLGLVLVQQTRELNSSRIRSRGLGLRLVWHGERAAMRRGRPHLSACPRGRAGLSPRAAETPAARVLSSGWGRALQPACVCSCSEGSRGKYICDASSWETFPWITQRKHQNMLGISARVISARFRVTIATGKRVTKGRQRRRAREAAAVPQKPAAPFAPLCSVTRKMSWVSKYHNKLDKRRRFQLFSFPWERWARCEGNIILGAAVRSRRREVGARDVGDFWSLTTEGRRNGGTLCMKPTRCRARHSTNPAKTAVSPALARGPRHGDGLGGGWGDRPTSGNARVASGPALLSLRGAILAGTGSSGPLSPLREGAEAPGTYLPWRMWWRARNCGGGPEPECRRWVRCCPTWQHVWRNASQLLDRGWDVPERAPRDGASPKEKGWNSGWWWDEAICNPWDGAGGRGWPQYLIQRAVSSPVTRRWSQLVFGGLAETPTIPAGGAVCRAKSSFSQSRELCNDKAAARK